MFRLKEIKNRLINLNNPRMIMCLAAVLDVLGQLFMLILLAFNAGYLNLTSGGKQVVFPQGWILFCVVIYPLLGWLLGSYTLLKWRSLPMTSLFQRVGLTAVFTALFIAVAHWISNPDDVIWLLHRRVQFHWLISMCLWSILVRLFLRIKLVPPISHRLILVAGESEANLIQRLWQRVPHHQHLLRLDLKEVNPIIKDCSVVAVGSDELPLDIKSFVDEQIKKHDPRRVQFVSPVVLFEREQERLPPALLRNGWLSYNEIPWASTFGLQSRLKRAADVIISLILLLATFPLICMAIVWIYLDDKGPIVYKQKRTGWMRQPITVLKLRTMHVQKDAVVATWTQQKDVRVTRPGRLLRKFRIDELPQLINVLRGDMSLIGPRPERPEMEDELERHIPFYRMRHWMRPGLSGWAQVCTPYASSIDDSDLKLSYDLFYLKNYSIWLDLVVFMRTIKTILKASGR